MSLTEQICTNNTLGCVGHKDGKCHSIENCKYKVEQPVITIGNKIRESNESLAEFIKTVTDKCIIGSCRTCPIYKACDQMENKDDLVKYFSQPYTK
jgi:hypothetical protein